MLHPVLHPDFVMISTNTLVDPVGFVNDYNRAVLIYNRERGFLPGIPDRASENAPLRSGDLQSKGSDPGAS